MHEYPGVVVVVSVGQPSPFDVRPPPGCLTASLVVGTVAVTLVVAVDEPTITDIDALSFGSIEVALESERNSAILIWKFALASGYSLYLESPLHVGLEIVKDFSNLSPYGLSPGEARALSVVVQDQNGIVRSMRLATIPTLILVRLAPLLTRQLAERKDRKTRRRHFGALCDYTARTRSPAAAFHAASVKARSV